MLDSVNIYDVKVHFSKLIHQAEGGHPVIIARAGKPIPVLCRYPGTAPERQSGQLKGKIDAPLPLDVVIAFNDKVTNGFQ